MSRDFFTVEAALNWITKQYEAAHLFFGHGTDNAWDEAVQLVCHVMNYPSDVDKSVLNNKISDIQAQRIHSIVDQRLTSRKPLSYLLQEAWFMGHAFYVDERVLVPRSPFAEWINRRFEPWVDPSTIHSILEVGTGSGCMAISAALMFPHAIVDAIDIDPAALDVARINVDRFQLTDSVNLYQSDVLDDLPAKTYQVIMSNPPYVSADEMAQLPEEYLTEPKHALEASDDGLAIAIKLLAQAPRFLAKEGVIIIELGNTSDMMLARFPSVPFIALEQSMGGHGLLLLSYDDIIQHSQLFQEASHGR